MTSPSAAVAAVPDLAALPGPPWDTKTIRYHLRAMYEGYLPDGRQLASSFAILEEVADTTGSASQYADMLVMHLWRSHRCGHELHGFELKASRADWLNELKDPYKASRIKAYCDRWWLVVGDPEIVKPGELPPDWGLIAPVRRGHWQMVRETMAPLLEPVAMDRAFLAAIMRRVTEQSIDKELLDAAEARGVAHGRELALNGSENATRAQRYLRHLRDELKQQLVVINSMLKGSPE